FTTVCSTATGTGSSDPLCGVVAGGVVPWGRAAGGMDGGRSPAACPGGVAGRAAWPGTGRACGGTGCPGALPGRGGGRRGGGGVAGRAAWPGTGRACGGTGCRGALPGRVGDRRGGVVEAGGVPCFSSDVGSSESSRSVG